MCRVGVDLDGVAYPFVDVLRAWRKSAYGLETPAPSGWNLAMNQEEFDRHCREAVEARWLFEVGQPIPGTAEGIRALREAGHTIHFVTARTKEQFGANTYDNTRRWLERWNLRYESLDFTHDKASIPTDIFIDDNISNVETLLAAGIDAWLMYDPPRIDQLGHPRLVMGWADFVAKVDDLNQRFTVPAAA